MRLAPTADASHTTRRHASHTASGRLAQPAAEISHVACAGDWLTIGVDLDGAKLQLDAAGALRAVSDESTQELGDFGAYLGERNTHTRGARPGREARARRGLMRPPARRPACCIPRRNRGANRGRQVQERAAREQARVRRRLGLNRWRVSVVDWGRRSKPHGKPRSAVLSAVYCRAPRRAPRTAGRMGLRLGNSALNH